MAKITTALVYVPSMKINSKEMTFDEVREFCKDNGLGVWDRVSETVIHAEEYPLKPAIRSIQTYGFFGPGTYETSPTVTLVPFGTTVDYGMFVFPKESEQ